MTGSAISMQVGFVGLGLLGLPMALAMAHRGHTVLGYDSNPARCDIEWYPGPEKGPRGESLRELMDRSSLQIASLERLVEKSELIFVAVQTPSLAGYDGSGPFPAGGVDYDLTYLRRSLTAIAKLANQLSDPPAVAVVSTILPGTLRLLAAEIRFGPRVGLAHNPAFSAVGTVIQDFLHPEFVLIGTHHRKAADLLQKFYASMTDSPVILTSPENAELIKTAYNGFISLKLCYANALMELAHKVPGCNVDTVVDCLSLAKRRLISPRYLKGGLGDGGGCHPKENAALSFLAQKLKLSFDLFGTNLICRDRQTEWLADLVQTQKRASGFDVWLLGTAFKADVAVEDGSPALLLHRVLASRGITAHLYDPEVTGRGSRLPSTPALFVLTTCHSAFRDLTLAPGSLVLDPWRFVKETSDVRVIPIGKSSERL